MEASARGPAGVLSLESREKVPWYAFHRVYASSRSRRRGHAESHGSAAITGVKATGYGFVRRERERFLSIPRPRIFDSSVERGIPSRAATPNGRTLSAIRA